MSLQPYSANNKIGTVRNQDGHSFVRPNLDDLSIGYSSDTAEIKVYGFDAINNMIENILRTTPGEREFEPTFGSQIPGLIFEPCDEITAYKMETAIFDALKQWMPYVSVVIQDTVVIPRSAEGIFDVRIVYILRVGNIKGQFNGRFLRG